MTCRPLRSGASGLRSSWASRARNSVLRRSSSCSALVELAFSIGDPDPARQVFRQRSVRGSLFRPDSAVAKVSTPKLLARDHSGTHRYDRRPRDRISRRCSSSRAPCTEYLVGNLLDERRLGGAEYLDGAAQHVRVGRVPPRQLVDQPDFVRVFVGDRQPAELAVPVRHVHGGPVGEMRDRQVHNLL